MRVAERRIRRKRTCLLVATLVIAVLTPSFAGGAQPVGTGRRIGYLTVGPRQPDEELERALRGPEEFRTIGGRIRELVGAAAVRIDHIGSTAVPGSAPKTSSTCSVTVADLDQAGAVATPLRAAGFCQGDEFVYDDSPAMAMADPGLRKLFMREPEGERRAHIHVRGLGRFNHRYALLFRDYLRASASAPCR